MAEIRRKFDQDFREGAVRLVRETGKPIAQVARDLGINLGTLENWVAKDRRGMIGAEAPHLGHRPTLLSSESATIERARRWPRTAINSHPPPPAQGEPRSPAVRRSFGLASAVLAQHLDRSREPRQPYGYCLGHGRCSRPGPGLHATGGPHNGPELRISAGTRRVRSLVASGSRRGPR